MKDTGQPLAQGSGVSIVKILDPAADVSSYFGFKYSFEFQNPIPLNSDTTYWLVLNLGVDNPTTSNTQAFWASTAQRFRSGAATSVAPTFPRWKEWATVDLAFQINGAIAPLPESVTIDIKPNKKTENVINLKKKNLKVAILGSIEFDALQVDPATVKFGTFDPDAASPIRFKGQDYNHDGYSDLILTFKLSETGIVCGVAEATLTGETIPGPAMNFTGTDSFTIEGCP